MTQQTNPPAFRVWCNDDKKWLQNVFINPCNLVLELKSEFNLENDTFSEAIISKKNVTICRFAGVIHNDKPVYEHDIGKIILDVPCGPREVEMTGVVAFEGSCWIIKCGHDYNYYLKDFDSDDIEILGNALKNPELLEGLE